MATSKSNRSQLRGSHMFPDQHGYFPIVDTTELATRSRTRGGRLAHRAGHSKSSRPPLRAHFSFHTNMATIRLWTLQNSARVESSVLSIVGTHAETTANPEIQSVSVQPLNTAMSLDSPRRCSRLAACCQGLSRLDKRYQSTSRA
eukprot:6692988-Pyramimonas_sp.AAC.1